MSCSNGTQELHEYWRHRDRLTWQLPSLLVVIAGALTVGAFHVYSLNISDIMKSIVNIAALGYAWFFSLCTIVMLAQNLYYQTLHEEKLSRPCAQLRIPVPKRKKNGRARLRNKAFWVLMALYLPVSIVLIPIVLGCTKGLNSEEEGERNWTTRLGNILTPEKAGSTLLLFLCGTIFCITSALYIWSATSFCLPWKGLLIAAWAIASVIPWLLPCIEFCKVKQEREAGQRIETRTQAPK